MVNIRKVNYYALNYLWNFKLFDISVGKVDF